MVHVGRNSLVFVCGGLAYNLVEVLWRGYSHWTMFFAGGLSVLFLFFISQRFASRPLWFKCLLGTAAITTIEFVFGYVFNIILGWHVWDYTALPFNFLGQISLLFSAMWYILSGGVFLLIHFLEVRLGARRYPYKEGRS